MTTKTIDSDFTAGYYLNPTYTTLDIGTKGRIYGPGITTTAAAPSTINNLGYVDGSDVGVTLADGGTLTNGNASDAKPLIEGMNAIVVNNAPGVLTNYGTVQSTPINGRTDRYPVTHDVGVLFNAGGTVSNAVGGAIESGISISGAVGSVINNGNIFGASAKLYFNDYYTGSDGGHGEYKVNDYSRAVAVTLNEGGSIYNGSESNIGTFLGGIAGSNGVVIVKNYGIIGNSYQNTYQLEEYIGSNISSSDTPERAINLTSGGTITNGTSIYHASFIAGVAISGQPRAITNFGTIADPISTSYTYRTIDDGYETETTESISYAVALNDGGMVTNGSSGDTNALLGGGIIIGGGAGVVVNYGSIQPTSYDYFETFRGSHESGGKVGYAIVLDDGGTIVNGSVTDTTATTGGVKLTGPGTITNFASISASASYYDAVKLSANAQSLVGTLIEEGSGVISGYLIGGGGTLELGSAAGAGTISGLGTTITGFDAVIVQAGAGWHLDGANTLYGTFANFAGVSEDGTLTNFGTISASAIITLASDSVLNNEGSLFLVGDVSISPVAGATGTSLDNAGLLEKQSGTGVSAIRVSLLDSGTIAVASGTLDLTGTVDTIDGAVSGAGTLLLDAGAVDLGAGTALSVSALEIGAGVQVTLATSLSFAHTFTAAAKAILTLGSLDTLALTGPGTFTGVTVDGAGHLSTLGKTTLSAVTLGGDGAVAQRRRAHRRWPDHPGRRQRRQGAVRQRGLGCLRHHR